MEHFLRPGRRERVRFSSSDPAACRMLLGCHRNVSHIVVEVFPLTDIYHSNFRSVGSQPFGRDLCGVCNLAKDRSESTQTRSPGDCVGSGLMRRTARVTGQSSIPKFPFNLQAETRSVSKANLCAVTVAAAPGGGIARSGQQAGHDAYIQ